MIKRSALAFLFAALPALAQNINPTQIRGVTAPGISGTGGLCLTTSCVMTTPTIGAATATTVNGNTFTAGTGTLNLGSSSLPFTVSSPSVNQILQWNGAAWTNGDSTQTSAGAGVTFFFYDTDIVPPGAGPQSLELDTALKTPSSGVETSHAATVNSSTVFLMSHAYEAEGLGGTSIDGGIWTFNTYAHTSSLAGANVSSIPITVAKVMTGVGTITMTGSGTSRTATVSGSTPFVSGDNNADITLTGWIQTPNGFAHISGFTGSSVVAVTVPSTYTNESGVAFKLHRFLFSTPGPMIDTTTVALHTVNSSQPAFSIAAADGLGFIYFARTTIASRTLTVYHEGAVNNTTVTSPLAVRHNDLAGLQGGTGSGTTGEYYHSTSAEYTGSGTGVFARSTSPSITTSIVTPSASFDVFNTTATTVNFAGAAAVALNIGHASAAAAFAGGISIAASKAITGNVANSTISGFLSVAATTGTFTNLGGTLSTAAQPNIASVGNTFTIGTGATQVGTLGFKNSVGASGQTIWPADGFVGSSDSRFGIGVFGSTTIVGLRIIANSTTQVFLDAMTFDAGGGSNAAKTLALQGANNGPTTFGGSVSLGSNSLTAGEISGTTGVFSQASASTQLNLIRTGTATANIRLYAVSNSLFINDQSGGGAGVDLASFTSAGINGVLGGTTPAAASVTTLSASGQISSNATAATDTRVLYGSGSTTGAQYFQLSNTSGTFLIGVENSVGGFLATGTSAYSSVIQAKVGQTIQLAPNNSVMATFSSTGLDVTGTLSVSTTSLLTGAVTLGAGTTTGTAADTLCLTAGGVIILQAAACTISSLRFKEDVTPYTATALDKVAALTPITFRMKGTNADWNYAQPQVGLAAENVAEVVKECALFEQDGVTPKSYRSECLVALVVKATQELDARVRKLEPKPCGPDCFNMMPVANDPHYRSIFNHAANF